MQLFLQIAFPGLRVGWLSPGRYTEKAAYLKFTQNIASPTLNQRVLDEYLRNGGMDKHVRKIRRRYAANIGQCIDLIKTTFPPGTRTSQPRGGFVLWVQLPGEFDTTELYQKHWNTRSASPLDIYFPAINDSNTISELTAHCRGNRCCPQPCTHWDAYWIECDKQYRHGN